MAKDYMLRVKMSRNEEKRFRSLADEVNLTFSAYVRMVLEEKHRERKEEHKAKRRRT